jgi:hypothetical protein
MKAFRIGYMKFFGFWLVCLTIKRLKLLIINVLAKIIRNCFSFLLLLAQFPCSNGGLRPSARLKKVFRAGKATQTAIKVSVKLEKA